MYPGNKLYTIERILKRRYRLDQLEYLVKWEGYRESESTWEPIANLHQPGIIDMISEFEEKQAAAPKRKPKACSLRGRPPQLDGEKKRLAAVNKMNIPPVGNFGIFGKDKPRKIVGHGVLRRDASRAATKKFAPPKIFYKLSWEKRGDGTQPDESYFLNYFPKQLCCDKIIDYYVKSSEKWLGIESEEAEVESESEPESGEGKLKGDGDEGNR